MRGGKTAPLNAELVAGRRVISMCEDFLDFVMVIGNRLRIEGGVGITVRIGIVWIKIMVSRVKPSCFVNENVKTLNNIVSERVPEAVTLRRIGIAYDDKFFCSSG